MPPHTRQVTCCSVCITGILLMHAMVILPQCCVLFTYAYAVVQQLSAVHVNYSCLPWLCFALPARCRHVPQDSCSLLLAVTWVVCVCALVEVPCSAVCYLSTRGDYNSRPSVKNPYKSRIAKQLYTYLCSASWPL